MTTARAPIGGALPRGVPMLSRIKFWCLACTMLALLWGCGSSSTGPTGDAGTDAKKDGGSTDSSVTDTTSPVDSGGGGDTTVADTAPTGDTSTGDTSMADTAPADTSPTGDTSTGDTSTMTYT